MRWLSFLRFLLLSPLLAACQDRQEASQLYFGQEPPGDTPAVFAPGLISKQDRFEQFLLYAPVGRELTFGVTNSDWSVFSLYLMKMENGRWSEPITAPFLGSDSSALTACLSFETGTTAFLPGSPQLSSRRHLDERTK